MLDFYGKIFAISQFSRGTNHYTYIRYTCVRIYIYNITGSYLYLIYTLESIHCCISLHLLQDDENKYLPAPKPTST